MKIIDLSSLLPGPLAASILGELGSEIIKIEHDANFDLLRNLQPTENGISVIYQELNKNKKLIRLDLRSDQGKAQILEEVRSADAIIENFRPHFLDKMGLGYQDLIKINPNLIYCSITGYGYEHPLSKKAAHDINILAVSGYLDYQSRYSEEMPLPPVQIADVITSYQAVNKILATKITGKATWLDISMLQAMQHLFTLTAPAEAKLEHNIAPNEMPLWGKYACYHIYKTKDDRYMVLAALEPAFWYDFCTTNKLTDYSQHNFSTSETVISLIQNIIAQKTLAEWVAEDNNYCLSPVYSYLEAKKLGFINY
ncbi:MAG: CaiB/BaiF CoA-transferase family protein [bacterium]